VVRTALGRERVEYHGETIELPLPDGPGKPPKMMIGPAQQRVPIYLAAIGPKNTALAGEIADGWIPTFFSPDHVAELRALLEEGAARGDRTLEGFDVAPVLNAYVSDDLERAQDAMRPGLALYIGGMGSRDWNFYNRLVRRYGFEAEARDIQELYLSGHKDEAAAAVPARLIDMVSLCGPPERVREQLEKFREAGAGMLQVAPMVFATEEWAEQLRVLAELARD
jgi:alkanesulfonate monooxygenase SsuD/methylene tetrahydromethanopterin reductase-like flavin-dependent oxidoreductase (luciferase family)